MMNLNDKNTRRHLVQKYLDAETSSREEKMLADYYAANGIDADEREIAALILSSSAGLDSILDEGNRAFENILSAENTRAKRKMTFRRYSYFAFAACIAALVILLRNAGSISDASPAPIDEIKGVLVADEVEIQEEETIQQPEVSETKSVPVPKAKKQPAPDLIAENSQHQELRFEDVFPSSKNGPDPDIMCDIEEELQQRLLADALEREVEARMARIIDDKETVNL